jgi:hypothetical protein
VEKCDFSNPRSKINSNISGENCIEAMEARESEIETCAMKWEHYRAVRWNGRQEDQGLGGIVRRSSTAGGQAGVRGRPKNPGKAESSRMKCQEVWKRIAEGEDQGGRPQLAGGIRNESQGARQMRAAGCRIARRLCSTGDNATRQQEGGSGEAGGQVASVAGWAEEVLERQGWRSGGHKTYKYARRTPAERTASGAGGSPSPRTTEGSGVRGGQVLEARQGQGQCDRVRVRDSATGSGLRESEWRVL